MIYSTNYFALSLMHIGSGPQNILYKNMFLMLILVLLGLSKGQKSPAGSKILTLARYRKIHPLPLIS